MEQFFALVCMCVCSMESSSKITGSLQGQVGEGFEQSGPVKGVPFYGRVIGTGWSLGSIPTQSILSLYDH